ncbi:hypothetical protein Q9189_005925 [Teloschistes chrysophthalmus]
MKFTLHILPVLLKALEVAARGPSRLDNPSLIEQFPPCAVECIIHTQETSVRLPHSFHPIPLTSINIFLSPQPCPFRDLKCQCSPAFRASAAACESITCSTGDYHKVQQLTDRLCAPLDNNDNNKTVSAAIATATSAATSALRATDPANPDTYPPCARDCITQALQADCGTFSNTKCVCQSPIFFANITPCELGTCPPADLRTTLYLSEANCNQPGIGGLGGREAQLAALDQTLGDAAGGDLGAFFDQLMEGGKDGSGNDRSRHDRIGIDGNWKGWSGKDWRRKDWRRKMMRRTDGPTAGAAPTKEAGGSFWGICGLWWFWCWE